MTPVPSQPNTFEPHPDRGAVLAETHARPFEPLRQVRRVIHFAFLTDAAAAEADRIALARFCSARGAEGPRAGVKHHRATFGVERLRWEQHSEFTTYSWEIIGESGLPFQPPAVSLQTTSMGQLPPPGPHLVSVDLWIGDDPQAYDIAQLFDTTSLTLSLISGGKAQVATDFRADTGGFVRLLVGNRGLNDLQLGLVVQTLLEIETYRTFALLGLAEARRQWPVADRIEAALVAETRAMRDAPDRDLETDQTRLNGLTALAAELEATAVAANFRFAASEAYEAILRDRLKALNGSAEPGYPSMEGFLLKRITPAVRTVRAIRDRQADLSRKLARAVNLLRTHVDLQLESQNREVLSSMNERTRLQLRLQQTVEGLSVAAISYYVIGLLSYLFKSLSLLPNFGFDPNLVTGLAVVPTVLIIYWLARRLRRQHSEDKGSDHSST